MSPCRTLMPRWPLPILVLSVTLIISSCSVCQAMGQDPTTIVQDLDLVQEDLIEDGEFSGKIELAGMSEEGDTWAADEVHELTDATFSEAVSRFDHLLVLFYATWCEACAKLEPELDAIASSLSSSRPFPIALAKLNAPNNQITALKHFSNSFPSLKLFVHGVPQSYSGPYKGEAIAAIVKKTVHSLEEEKKEKRGEGGGGGIALLFSDDEVKAFLEENVSHFFPAFVAFGLPSLPSALIRSATVHRNQAWFASAPNVTEATMAAFDFDKVPAILSSHPHGDTAVFYPSSEDPDSDLSSFVSSRLLPLLSRLDPDSLPRALSSSKLIVLIMAEWEGLAPPSIALDAPPPARAARSKAAAESAEFVRRCKPLASTFLPSFLFTYLDASEYPVFVRSFGVNSSSALPRVVVWDGKLGYYQPEDPSLLQGPDMELHFSRFLKAVQEGRIPKLATRQLTWMEQIHSAINHPQFPIVVVVVILAILMKMRAGGENVILPRKLGPSQPRQRSTRGAAAAAAAAGGGDTAAIDSSEATAEDKQGEGEQSEAKPEKSKKDD